MPIIPSIAQLPVAGDGTLSTNVTSADRLNFTIDGGNRAGNNLFHSFREFSVPTGGSAVFNHANDVQTIFGRVTGGNISNIDGLIKTGGSANLFLINPSGIMFGSNAQLNIGGSFIGSTAERITFKDGIEFDAYRGPTAQPLLTISVPIGLHFGQQPGNIQVQGNSNSRLAVPSGRTLALVGGDMVFSSGSIVAPSGRIELGSVGSGGSVKLNNLASGGFMLDYSSNSQSGDIRFVNGALVDVSGSGGILEVFGRRISILEYSSLTANTNGTNTLGANILLQATELIKIDGENPDLGKNSNVTASLLQNSTGESSRITVNTPQLNITNGGRIIAQLWGIGKGTDVQIDAKEIFMANGFVSTIMQRSGVGEGGKMTINADQLKLTSGSRLNADMFGRGKAGDIAVRARDVEVSGISYVPRGGRVFNFNSWLSSTVDSSSTFSGEQMAGEGQGGNITIEANQVRFLDGGTVRVDTLNKGNGGSLTIRTQDLEISGVNAVTGRRSRLGAGIQQSHTGSGGIGQGGSITIDTARMKITDGGLIELTTNGNGSAGNLAVRATDSVTITGNFVNRIGEVFNSGIDATILPTRKGTGGNINIDAKNLVIGSGGRISSSTEGFGNAGNIMIRAGNMQVSEGGSVTAGAGIKNPNATGNAGSVKLTVDELMLRNGGEVAVSSPNSGNAGDILIDGNMIILDSGGSFKSVSNAGNRGNIRVNTEALVLRQGGNISTNASGTANGGNIILNAGSIVGLDDSDITANAIEGQGGNVQITTQGLFGIEFRPQLTQSSDITASSEFGVNGTVEVRSPDANPQTDLAELPTNLVDYSQQITKSCNANSENSFTITGRGGIIENPMSSYLDVNRTWQDVRPYSNTNTITTWKPVQQSAPLVEATTWRRNAQGEIELVATKPLALPESSSCL